MDSTTQKEYLKIGIRAALHAGREIMAIYENSDFQVEYKKDDSPLTIADKNAHECIMTYLEETAIPVLSEEGKNIPFKVRKKWDEFWCVDPLDGTKEFIKRNGEFTVNIALIKDRIPVAGVVYAPVLDKLYFGATETGAFHSSMAPGIYNDLNIDKLLMESEKMPEPRLSRPYTVVGSRSHMNKDTEKFIGRLKEKLGPLDFISKGSSLKICMVAEGKADIYPRFAPTMEWDTAAGHAVAAAAGCKITRKNQKSNLLYNKRNLRNPWFIIEAASF